MRGTCFVLGVVAPVARPALSTVSSDCLNDVIGCGESCDFANLQPGTDTCCGTGDDEEDDDDRCAELREMAAFCNFRCSAGDCAVREGGVELGVREMSACASACEGGGGGGGNVT